MILWKQFRPSLSIALSAFQFLAHPQSGCTFNQIAYAICCWVDAFRIVPHDFDLSQKANRSDCCISMKTKKTKNSKSNGS